MVDLNNNDNYSNSTMYIYSEKYYKDNLNIYPCVQRCDFVNNFWKNLIYHPFNHRLTQIMSQMYSSYHFDFDFESGIIMSPSDSYINNIQFDHATIGNEIKKNISVLSWNHVNSKCIWDSYTTAKATVVVYAPYESVYQWVTSWVTTKNQTQKKTKKFAR